MLVAGLREHLKDGRLGTHRPRAVLRPFERLTSEEQAAVLHGLRQDAFALERFRGEAHFTRAGGGSEKHKSSHHRPRRLHSM